MRKLVLIAAMLMASASAHAGSFSFKVEGQNVRVHIPRGCASLSCINVSAPGLSDKFKDKDDTTATPAPTTTAAAPAPAPTPAPAPAPAPASQPIATAPAAEPIAPPPAAASQTKITVLTAPEAAAPAASTASTLTAPQVSLPAPAPAAAPAPAPTQVASAAPAPPPAASPDTPIGVWMSEKKEGKVRIEDCGGNLCGYAVDAKTGANGAKVLINMKPRGDKWAGRIHDTRSGGTYDSTIALRGTNKLKVQGCAFGGMFCGGETWTRVE